MNLSTGYFVVFQNFKNLINSYFINTSFSFIFHSSINLYTSGKFQLFGKYQFFLKVILKKLLKKEKNELTKILKISKKF